LIWLERTVVERIAAMRRPRESYSDVILRLAGGTGRSRMLWRISPTVLHSFAITGPTARSRRRLNHDRRGATFNPLKVARGRK
jgi:hypothetical protein